ncbi:Tyrosine recombinase XerC (plasmid) [Pararobbsia alpina]|uniref:tyrosine-type recombinase/integrase n=1 Tax=Pararobbsia alpina TaxID=621374 RepID=UPI0039A4E23C
MESDLLLWRSNPSSAYARWQEREAEGADRRPFSSQSIVQHRSMFERFNRFLTDHGASLATFGSDHVDTFLAPGGFFAEDTTTRIRYAKLVDRLCRHLVEIGVRHDNPAFDLLRRLRWPDGEGVPAYLDELEDAKLQELIQPRLTDDERASRNRAMVALLLGSGVTATEFQRITLSDIHLESAHPYVSIAAHGSRPARTVQFEQFALSSIGKWLAIRVTYDSPADLLFPSRRGNPFTVASLGNVVRDALEQIDVIADDMSPRLLRNTDCRRRLLAGQSADEVTYRLGLTSNRTVERMRATLDGIADPQT